MRRSLTIFLAIFISFGLTSSSSTQTDGAIDRERAGHLEDFDIRANLERSLPEPPEDPAAAGLPQPSGSKSLKSREGVKLKWSSLSRIPSRVYSLERKLSEAGSGDAELAAKRFLKSNQDLFRLSAGEVNSLRVARRHRSEKTGATHLALQQYANGIEIFQSEYSFHLDRRGAIIAAAGELIPGAERASNPDRPRLSSTEALDKAAGFAGARIEGSLKTRKRDGVSNLSQTISNEEGGKIFNRDVEARLVYFPLTAERLVLAWELILWMRETPDTYLILIDAERGSLLYRYNLTWYCVDPDQVGEQAAAPHGMVYLKDSPRPDVPHSSLSPVTVEREDAPFRSGPYPGARNFDPADPHYDWWAGQPPTGLISNNADVRLDQDANDRPDEPRLTAPEGNFTYPIDLSVSPTRENNRRAAQVNLFYWINRYHDILYQFGFKETSGNFQTKNFNLGGAGEDPILADAQDGSGTNNANFSAGRDGSPGRIQMFLWSGNPQLDGDLDQSIILHELTHGLTTRVVGNGTGLTGIQGRGMGEGWSDYFGIVLLRTAGDDLDGKYPVGQYATNNYSLGIRRYPYSTDPNVYPLNYGDISRNVEVHAVGEIWCNTLLEMRALLIRRLGFEEGQRQSIQLVVDGLKLTPSSPTFIDARNAILLADRMSNDGANQCLIWQAFSKRGLGFSAGALDSNDGSPTESFDMPPFCSDLATIRFDRRTYLLGETMRITVGDRNASAPVGLRLRSSITGDEEVITLTPDPVFVGYFTGSLRLAAGRATPLDGSLQASLAARDRIIAAYEDLNTGNGGTTMVSERVDVAGEKIVFEDSVERGNPGWNAIGPTTPFWGVRVGGSSISSRYWTDSPQGNYPNNADSSLVSPLLDLSQAASVTLAFAHSYILERGYDYGVVEYSIDDGATWVRATAYTGTETTVAQARVQIDALAGQPRARIRFRLKSDNFSTADGWCIDDIRIIARSSDPAFLPPASELSPYVISVNPAFGAPDGETTVAIDGANFTETEDVKVFFDGLTACEIMVQSGAKLTATTPKHPPGPVSIRIETRYGSTTLANAFTYFMEGDSVGAPAINNLFPNSGSSRGGALVTLNGSNFTPETAVNFGAQQAKATYLNPNTLQAVAPASNNQATGPVDVSVINPAQPPATLNRAFTYHSPTPPAAQLISPNGGERVYTGAALTISWRSSDDRAVVRHRLALYQTIGGRPQLYSNIADFVPGESQSFNWKIPVTTKSTSAARIRLVAIDDEGSETEVYSSRDFTIERRWETAKEMLERVQRSAVASDGKYIYVFGGRYTNSSSTTTATVQRYHPSANPSSWTSESVQAMPKGLNSGEAVYLNGRVYIPGGINSQVEIDTSHLVYDVPSNTWSTQASPPAPVFLYALAVNEEKGVYYLTGGSDTQAAVAKVAAYDTRTRAWEELPPMQTARYGHEAALIDGKLYVAGGSGTAGSLTSAEVYDFTTRQWSPIAGLSRPRRYAINAPALDADGRKYWLIIGGEDATSEAPLDSIEAYDIENDRWIRMDSSFSLPAARTRLGGAILNGFLHAVGGTIQSAGTTAATDLNERFKLDGFTLISPNQPPLVVVPDSVQIAVPDEEIKFNVYAQDLRSGVPVNILADGLPNGARFDVANQTNNSARGIFTWTPAASDLGREISINFTASDGQSIDVKSVSLRVVKAGLLTAVNAADFRPGPLAPDSIASVFGANLAQASDLAGSQPLPFSLAETTLTINGIEAPLFFVSPDQINFAVPWSLDPGRATIMVKNSMTGYAIGKVEIGPAAPAIFTQDATGKGLAAAVATIDGATYQSSPFDVIIGGRSNVLVLYGTAIRRAIAENRNDENGVAESINVTIDGVPARVLYAGAQGAFSGLDQINIELPPSLAGRGRREVEVIVSVNGVSANTVTIQIK